MSGGEYADLKDASFDQLDALRSLNLADNQLADFSIPVPKYLEQLTLSHNPMAELRMADLAPCQEHLRVLRFGDSSLTNVTVPAGLVFEKLTELVVTGNKI